MINLMKPTDCVSATSAQAGSSRPLILAATFFLIGAAITGAWFLHQQSQAAGRAGGLSGQTRNLLSHLETPVNLRYYRLLPTGSVTDEQQAFAGRVETLLNAIQQVRDNLIQVTRLDAAVETNFAAASADGLRPFNLDKGEACYLGICISSGTHKETLAQLQPEWESALQYDLTRAILRVAAAEAPAPLAPEVAKPSAEIINSIKMLIPDTSTVSAAEADQIFHAEFLKECAQAGTEMEKQINAARDRVIQAQKDGSAEELAAARKNLQKVQLEQGEKFKQVAADLQTRMAVFQQMKASSSSPEK